MELKATDLRVGNWVNRKYYNPEPNNEHWALEPCLLCAINIGGRFNVKLKNGGHSVVDYLEPIPLTEEWLVKFNGKKISQTDWLIKIVDVEFYCRHNKKWYSSIGNIYLSDRIQFVHQLQNLYHALTGQDL